MSINVHVNTNNSMFWNWNGIGMEFYQTFSAELTGGSFSIRRLQRSLKCTNQRLTSDY